ncbi:hypothetical protein LIER_01522 [Lithospermum erythrorhizon]|uniref:DC1 domain-containing protein n=1 Tax=Lithospermum erythrorhizon TaxID=34254 RepID=A0AAV3NPU9_LITER
MAFQNNQHFSHPHALHHLKFDELRPFSCDACHENIITTQPFHGCPPCDYHLHSQCFNAPLHLQHPSHPNHPLNLIPNPSYSSIRSFNCDGCGFDGHESCYNCPHCNFDIHLRCANLPMSLLINEHHHALRLFLKSPYNNSNIGFQCDICHGLNENRLWSYYCHECDFGTHVGCAMKFKETTYNSSIDRDQETLDAAIIKAKFAAKAGRAILGHHRRINSDGYYSSSDDGLI